MIPHEPQRTADSINLDWTLHGLPAQEASLEVGAVLEPEISDFVNDAMNARLIRLEIDTIGGVSERSRAELTRLADQAAAKGLGRIESRARELASS